MVAHNAAPELSSATVGRTTIQLATGCPTGNAPFARRQHAPRCTRGVLRLFAHVERHVLLQDGAGVKVFEPKLTDIRRQVLGSSRSRAPVATPSEPRKGAQNRAGIHRSGSAECRSRRGSDPASSSAAMRFPISRAESSSCARSAALKSTSPPTSLRVLSQDVAPVLSHHHSRRRLEHACDGAAWCSPALARRGNVTTLDPRHDDRRVVACADVKQPARLRAPLESRKRRTTSARSM
jgi:hypothetical protein